MYISSQTVQQAEGVSVVVADWVTTGSGGHGAPAITASTSATERGHTVKLSIPVAVMRTSSSRRTPPKPRNLASTCTLNPASS
jgi:hypothetical protein